MKTINFLTSSCRYCRYYKPEGRRGGICNRLEVPVESSWKACSLALPPFACTVPTIEKLVILTTPSNQTTTTIAADRCEPISR
ncbi:MAG: hypothetical protein ACFBSE_08790 [Prochloraceae cyanobacterium]